MCSLVAEGHVLQNAIGIRLMNYGGFAEAAATFGLLGLEQVTASCAWPQHLAAGGDFEPLGHGLLRLDTFRASHNSYLFP